MPGVSVRVQDPVTPALQSALRGLHRGLQEGLKVAGTTAVLPRVKRHAPSIITANLTARPAAGSGYTAGYITTQGPRVQDRITGLLNWGGTVTTEIVPTRKQAIKIGNTGEVRANVQGPRTYRAQHFIERGVDESVTAIGQAALPSIMKVFGGMSG